MQLKSEINKAPKLTAILSLPNKNMESALLNFFSIFGFPVSRGPKH